VIYPLSLSTWEADTGLLCFAPFPAFIFSPALTFASLNRLVGKDAITLPHNWRIIINTHTETQVKEALETLAVVFEDNPDYEQLSASAKDLLANALLTACELIK
jgi:hypothetical protein